MSTGFQQLIFGERSLTKVAGIYSTAQGAEDALISTNRVTSSRTLRPSPESADPVCREADIARRKAATTRCQAG